MVKFGYASVHTVLRVLVALCCGILGVHVCVDVTSPDVVVVVVVLC